MDIDMKDVAVREDAHCVFNVNSYQMVFVANSESVLYKRHAFSRAKQVTNRFLIICSVSCHFKNLLEVACIEFAQPTKLLFSESTVSQSGDLANEEAFPGLAAAMGVS
jgi:cystathionine beta-lyase/cystathionine gamma-synthase